MEIEASDRCDWDSYKSDSPIVSPGQLGFDSGSENEEQKVHDEEQAEQRGSKETWQHVYREQFAARSSLLPLPQGMGYGPVIAEESWHEKPHGSTETWQELVAKTKGYGKGKDGDKGGGKSNDGGKDGGKSKDGGKDGGKSKDGGKGGSRRPARRGKLGTLGSPWGGELAAGAARRRQGARRQREEDVPYRPLWQKARWQNTQCSLALLVCCC